MNDTPPEGNTRVQLHNQSWSKLLTMIRDGEHSDNPTVQAMGDTIEAQLSFVEETSAIGFAGLPGAGKSYIAEELADFYDVEVITMGDAIRREYAREEFNVEGLDEVDNLTFESAALAKFAADTRDESPEVIPRWTADLADSLDDELVIVDGIRSVTDYEVLDSHFDNFDVVWVKSDFNTRLQRIQDRDREGEGDFMAKDLHERDRNELERLGVGELLDTYQQQMVSFDNHSNQATKKIVSLYLSFDYEVKNEYKAKSPMDLKT